MKKMSIMLTLLLIVVMFIFSACTTNEPMTDKNAEMEEEKMAPETPETPGSYESYSPQKVAGATGNTVLFFHASWCPTCRGLEKDIENNLNNIPTDLTILKVNYDEETELKQKYGVTTQHTLVQVDSQGTLIKKWSGGSSLERLVSQVQ